MADYIQNGGKNGGSYASHFSGILRVWEHSYDVTSNLSVVMYELRLKSGSSGRFSDLSASYSISINGSQVKSGSGRYSSQSYNTEQIIASGSVTVGHNSDGSKTVSCSANLDFQNHSYSPGDFTPSGNLTLTKIPRYLNSISLSNNGRTINSISCKWTCDPKRDWTQYSLNGGTWTDAKDSVASDNKSGTFTISNLNPNTTYKVKVRLRRSDSGLYSESNEVSITTYDYAKLVSVPNINIGSAHTVTWTNPSGATTSLKLCKTDNSQIINYGNVTGTSKSITPTANTIYALTPNSNTYKARYILTTTQNGKSYTSTKDFTCTVTNSNPTFPGFTFADTNTTITALTGDYHIFVKGYSNVKIAISTANKAIAKNGATMARYKWGDKTVNYSNTSEVVMTTNGVTNNVMDVYAVDSRGNSTKVSKTATIKDYFKPTITRFTATRTNNVGSETTLSFEINFWNGNFGKVQNTIGTCKYQYKLTSASSYTSGATALTYSVNGNKATGSIKVQGDAGANGFNINNSFNIQLIVSDKLNTVTNTITLGSGNPAIAIYKNRVAIGQKYDTSRAEDDKLQVNGFVTSTKGIRSKQRAVFYNEDTNNICISPSSNSGNIYFRPKGVTTDTNQAYIDQSGNFLISRKARANCFVSNRTFRQTNANISATDAYTAGIEYYGASSSMTSNKPSLGDGHILHFHWDNTSGYDSQLFLRATTGQIMSRGCNGGTWGSWKRVFQEYVLYENASGTTGTVTLNETSANFAYIDIFYSKGGYFHNSVRVFSPNGKKTGLVYGYKASTLVQFGFREVAINGTSITNVSNAGGGLNTSSATTVTYDTIEMTIHKVVGYK